jgi:hypothetical protein
LTSSASSRRPASPGSSSIWSILAQSEAMWAQIGQGVAGSQMVVPFLPLTSGLGQCSSWPLIVCRRVYWYSSLPDLGGRIRTG